MVPDRSETLRRVAYAMAVIVVVVNSVILFRLQEEADCQSDYNVKVAQIISIRAKLTERADNNQNALLGGVARLASEAEKLGREPTPAEVKKNQDRFRKLLSDFSKEAAAIDAERKSSPVPQVPGCAQD